MAGHLNIPKFADYRNKVKRHRTKKFPVLSLSRKNTIAIHHSLTRQNAPGSNAEGYARYHVDAHGWPSIGYSYVIEPDGTVKWCNDIELRTYHVGNHNNYAVGICLTGDFRYEKPTQAQATSLRQLVSALQSKYTNLRHVKGHHEFSGYEWKQCQEFDYKSILANKGAEQPVKGLPNTYKIQEGDTFWSIAKGLDDLSVNDLKAANPGVDPTKLKIGQVINLGQAKKASKPSNKATGEVATIQDTVNKRYGYNISVDNIPGPETFRALLMAYQLELNKQFNAGLVVDGIWGSRTRAASVTVRRGARGNLTWVLQAMLRCKGYSITVDSIFGSGTENTVRAFQRDVGIAVDGIPGKNTFAKLFQ